MASNNYPKLHNAMWPGLVGKKSMGGPEGDILLDQMLDLTAKAEVNGVKFDGVDLFLNNPHTDINISDDGLKALADKLKRRGLVVGSIVAPVWFFGSAMGDEAKRAGWVDCVAKTIRVAAKLRELGVRPYGVVRIDSSAGVTDWDKDPKENTKLIAQTFRAAGKIAKDHGERVAALLLSDGDVEVALLVALHLGLIDRGQTGGAQETFDGLFGCADLGALAFLFQVVLTGGQARKGDQKAARRGVAGRSFRRDALFGERLDHQVMEALRRTLLHAGGDFLREDFKQEIGHD